jgi:cbb3-type cytochrome c oxidase subunit III
VARPAALLLTLLLAGCGTGGLGEASSSGADGEAAFKEKCGTCHTLAAAGTVGTIGPNLDNAFAAPREEDFDETVIREVVLGQMRFPIAPMPEPEQLFAGASEEEREDTMDAIAAYVASVASNQTAIKQAQQQGGGEAGANDPKGVFASNCGGCHTLAAAGTTGKVGPNLDQLTIPVARIEEQIRKGGGGMPPFEGKLSDAQINALAKWVAENRKG